MYNTFAFSDPFSFQSYMSQSQAELPETLPATLPEPLLTKSAEVATPVSTKPAEPAVSAKPAEPAPSPTVPPTANNNDGVSAATSPSAPPDRSVEMAGLTALMEAQKLREANQKPVQTTAEGQRIDWTTHKKEGMRLKRLMEENADGATSYPHMAKLWNGSKEDMWGSHVEKKTIFTYIVCFTPAGPKEAS